MSTAFRDRRQRGQRTVGEGLKTRRTIQTTSIPATNGGDSVAELMTTNSAHTGAFDIRRAQPADVDAMALAHRDSIQSIGPAFYPLEVVERWQEAVEGQLYLKAMDAGEVFFVAVAEIDGRSAVIGFASDYCIEGQKHGTSVYVRGRSARQGVGSALLARAEAHAVSLGAASIEIEASLAGVPFYEANGFVEVRRGQTRLTTGQSMECVFMRKDLPNLTS